VLLIDNSAWARIANPGLPAERVEQVARWIEAGSLAACVPFVLEAGYSARSAADHDRVIADLIMLPWVDLTPRITSLAIQAQGEMARVGHHRVPPADLLIAACAHSEGAGVLHYDRDYDLIAKHSGLDFQSEWLASAGSL
jgi:predicted nucleic acid-binding protein